MALRPTSTSPADRDTLQQDVFLREVDDALREEELIETFKRHGVKIAAVVTIGLAALAGYLWWDNSKTAAQAANSQQLAAALDKIEAGQVDAGLTAIAPLTKDKSGTGVAARLMSAAVLAQQGKADQAARDFSAVAADSSAPQPFRDLALIRATAIQFDKLQPQLVIDRLKPLAVPGKPWFGSAGEMTAMAHMRLGHNDAAGALFAQIAKDEKAPESLRNRARQIAGLLGVDAIDNVNKAAGIAEDPANTNGAGQPAAASPAKP